MDVPDSERRCRREGRGGSQGVVGEELARVGGVGRAVGECGWWRVVGLREREERMREKRVGVPGVGGGEVVLGVLVAEEMVEGVVEAWGRVGRAWGDVGVGAIVVGGG